MDPARAPGDRTSLLIQAGLALASEIDLDAVLDRIVELAIDITGARYGALGVLGEDTPRIERFVTKGVSDRERAAIGDPPVGHGILGLLIAERRPVRIPDISKDPRAYGFPPNHPPMRSFLGAPVSARGRVFGNIYLTEKRGADGFTDDDEDALAVLATQAGVAIENARLYEEARRAQRELARLELLEDRERIAKELHDGVIQSLFAVGMGLQATAGMSREPDLVHRLEDAVEEIDRAIRDLRNYIFGLRPGILADRQLDQALRELGSAFGTRSGVLTIVEVDPEVAAELTGRATDLVQFTREALSNVERHAQATSCRVSLRRDPGGRGAELMVDDDGIGFDAGDGEDGERWEAGGMGLANLRARAGSLGGPLTVRSEPGEGTTLTLRLPPSILTPRPGP